jgi:hypothetical protein
MRNIIIIFRQFFFWALTGEVNTMPETSAKTVSVTLNADIGARIDKLAEARHRPLI